MKREPRILVLEEPDTHAIVDILDVCMVDIQVVTNRTGDKQLVINVKHGGDAYVWNESDFVVNLTQLDEEE